MRKLLFAVVCFGLLLTPAFAGDNAASTWNLTNSDGSYDSGWVVGFPTGSSDYFNERHDFATARMANGLSLCQSDFGAGTSYPVLGLFDPNFGVDGTGNTPDLSTGISTGGSPAGGALYDCVYSSFGSVVTIAAGPKHVVVQLPPGDSGLAGVGQDDSGLVNFGGWTNTGYSTPANATNAAWGLNVNIAAADELPGNDGAMAEYLNLGDETGDFTTVQITAGDDYGVVFFAPATGTLWMFFLSFLGMPVKATTGVLPTIPDGTGHAFLRGGTNWPLGFGGFTFNFVGVSGIPGVLGTVGTSNEITIITNPDPGCNWGTRDDGTFEGGWVVGNPGGSSDYFNVNYNCLTSPGVTNITDIQIAVMDFGATASAYPSTGVFDTNFGLDASGMTPDLSLGYQVLPFTYVPGTFISSTGASPMPVRTFATAIPYSTFASDDIHGVAQLVPGDPGLLGIGGDTINTAPNWKNAWTNTGYSTPANDFSGTAGFGIRLGSN